MMTWRRFLAAVAGLTVGLTAALWAAVLVIDPFDVLAFSPDLRRAAMDSNQRFAYPALARDPDFDSLVIGTSVGRLLRPDLLSRRLGGRFANLSMNAATPWEQYKIFSLFRRHHPSIATVVLEIDPIWCKRDKEKLTNRPFPAWMYDESPWNDVLPHLSLYGIEQAGRQLAFLLGLRPARFARDGYARYLPPPEDYDLERVRKELRSRLEREQANGGSSKPLSRSERRILGFADHDLMTEMLSSLPSETRKVMIFAPMHRAVMPEPGSKGASVIAECKARLVRIAAEAENVHVLDFMIESDISRQDSNFWDGHHFRDEVADQLIELIAAGLSERRGQPDRMDYIDPKGLQ